MTPRFDIRNAATTMRGYLAKDSNLLAKHLAARYQDTRKVSDDQWPELMQVALMAKRIGPR